MTDTCHHSRNLMWGCSECELEGKLSELRIELSKLRLTSQSRLELNNTLTARLGALEAERDRMRDRITQLENEVESDGEEMEKLYAAVNELEEKALERAGRIGALEVELEAERMKVFELEKQLNQREWGDDV